MSDDQTLLEATFNPNAVKYFTLQAAIVCLVTVVLIPVIWIVVPLVYILQTIQYKRISCELTTRSLKVRRGVLNKVEKTIPLDKITDLGLRQGPIMRMFDIEQIHIETAGQSAVGSSAYLTGIEDGCAFRDRVLAQRDLVTESAAGPTPTPVQSSDDRMVETLVQIRDALHRIEAKINE